MTAAVSDFIPIRRVRKGQEIVAEILVELDGDKLTIRDDWSERRQDFRDVREYRVEASETPMGRAFHLHRDAEAVEKDPDHEPSYWVLIAGNESRCDCKGNQSTERAGRTCKHLAAVRHLISVEAL